MLGAAAAEHDGYSRLAWGWLFVHRG
jgi:hypothetical protein